MGAYRIVRKGLFERDLDRYTSKDAVTRARIEKRVAKLGENPRHHGYPGKEELHGCWVAGCTDRLAIAYVINEQRKEVTVLRLLELPNY